jgi:hypothetical protein
MTLGGVMLIVFIAHHLRADPLQKFNDYNNGKVDAKARLQK